MSWLEGQDDLTKECREKFWPTFALDCLFWLPTQAVNFALVPPPLRVVFIGVACFFWLNILCVVKNIESYLAPKEGSLASPEPALAVD